ncbi:hypothetical protein Fuma_06092 [Fuerstiella marisgermanici]|uniref:Uncharacterized protein n=1 Tax=Fuerstiella marisgermanici TaxID=1891926 RepID=A0A1P8WQT6_9PLAN|nr:hypothetical protein Fuma_06092 [Fuerstiella marisgermanici]
MSEKSALHVRASPSIVFLNVQLPRKFLILIAVGSDAAQALTPSSQTHLHAQAEDRRIVCGYSESGILECRFLVSHFVIDKRDYRWQSRDVVAGGS